MPERHLRVSGGNRAARTAAILIHQPGATAECDRRLRGPYTGTGTIMRALVPAAAERHRRLVRRHAIEILAVAPELESLTGPAPGTLTSQASGQERTRWYSRQRTRRIAHGLVEFLHALAGASQDAPLTLALDGLDEADPTDVEFASIALRRLDPAQVRLIVCSREAEVPGLNDSPAEHRVAGPAEYGPGDAAAYVASDCTSDNPADEAAYLAAPFQVRERLHQQRAAELRARGEWSLSLGAIPFHLERGSSPATDGRQALQEAIAYCIGMGYYDAALELTRRLERFIDPAADPSADYLVHAQMCQCLAALERPEETEPLYYEMMARSVRPGAHMNVSYALAMLYTRIYDTDHKDHRRALAHVNTAVAIAGRLEDPASRAFHEVFMNNGKALVEMHLGNLTGSLRLLDDGITRLNRDLEPGQHRLHRSVLHHNRAQVLAALGRAQEALADFDHVIAIDPHYPEYRFDRGNLHSKLGHYTEAITDYTEAMAYTPPFPELYYNRGDAHAAAGDAQAAASDFRYVLELEPGYTEASISLATILLESGDPGAAIRQARAALASGSGEPRLHCVLGLALMEAGQHQAASEAFDAALELDPGMLEALVNRAVAGCELGSYDDAARDLTAALATDPANPDLLYNRGYVYQSAGRHDAAVIDYTVALADDQADRQALLYQRAQCLINLGQPAAARSDLTAHLALGDSPHTQQVHNLLEQHVPV